MDRQKNATLTLLVTGNSSLTNVPNPGAFKIQKRLITSLCLCAIPSVNHHPFAFDASKNTQSPALSCSNKF